MMQFDEEADLQIMSPAQFKRNPHCRRVSPIDPTPLVDPYQQNSTNKFYSRQSIVKSY
ncbi:MAG: hypothetical protein ACTIMD_00555 [Loigolactobacillus coryniformis]